MSGTEKVPKAVREGRKLLDYFYGFSRSEKPKRRYLQKDEFRQDVYRLIIIQMHLSIEDLVRSFVFARLTSPPDPDIFSHKENVEFVHNMNYRQILELAARLHVLTKLGYDELVLLNSIRNKCSHNWMLHSFSVQERIRTNEQPGDVVPKISFKGRNLLTPKVMKDVFLPLYGGIYLELWAIHSGLDYEHFYADESLEDVEQD